MMGFELGAADYISKPISPPIVKARVKTQLALHDQNRMLEKQVRERTEELELTRLEIIRRLSLAAEYKDNETGMHVIRMSHYSKLISLKHGFGEREAELMLHAAPMHDVGKIGIPDQILLKPGALDEKEWEIMKEHTRIGGDIIGEHSSELLQWSRTVAVSHHEKWDGSGYPKGLKGTDIPIVGRIVAIADVFDALTSKRPYKAAWPVEDSIRFIKENSGVHFDPDQVENFIACMPEVLEIKEKYS